jgi:hypothetical protein
VRHVPLRLHGVSLYLRGAPRGSSVSEPAAGGDDENGYGNHPPGVGIQGEREVEVEGEKGTINLPAARIIGSSLNEDKTKLYDRDLGLLRVRGDDALIEEARQDAIDRIEATARENDIIEQGDNNAEDRLSVASR